MNIKKMFTTLSAMVVACAMLLPNASVLAASYSQELQDAYNWAYSKGVTTMSPIDNANMYGAITRAEMAKMLAVYDTEVLGNAPETSAACVFSDIDSVKGDLHDYIIESCQLGIMGQGISQFRPYDTISRAEFGTALSRVLWGSQYEGGTPYYAKHLDALKAAGIMTQISNAESTKEIRGYVMLMLMRSEGNDAVVDCDDPMTVIACTTNTDACPAACREADNTPSVVKAGDLAVTATPAANRKIVVSNKVESVSDLDTLRFKTSEEVTISKIVLERYGYSDADAISGVRLEDQDGNVIAEAKGLTKDKVTLSLKKDYKTVDGTFDATIVVRMVSGADAGQTIGFKVVDAVSTAKNLNLDDYTPYTYETVVYNGARLDVEIKGNAKDYNYEAGEMYEVARLKATAHTSTIYVKGFTLTNASGLDVRQYLDKLTVTVAGTEVSGLKYSVNKDDELVVSFNDYAIELNKNATFVVEASFAEDFDEYGETIAYYVAAPEDVNAVEKKTGARVTVNSTFNESQAKAHTFAGGKIKIANTKLGGVDAAQGSEGVVVAEGNITITEPLSRVSFTIEAKDNTGIENMYFVVDGEEYEGTRSATTSGAKFKFNNVEIEKSGKVQFKIDVYDNDYVGGTVQFSTFNKDAFAGSRYDTTNKPVQTGDVAGSISFSKVTIQAAKGTLKNTLDKENIEYLYNETNRKVVFDGTYTAKKADVYLASFYMTGTEPTLSGNTITYYLSIDGEEVADTDMFNSEEAFADILVKAGKTVSVKLEAEVEAYGSTGTYEGIKLALGGHDVNDKDLTDATAAIKTIKVKESGSITVSAGAAKNTVLLKSSTANIAEFTVKPANEEEGMTLDSLKLAISGTNISDWSKVEVTVDGEDFTPNAQGVIAPEVTLDKDGVVVKVDLIASVTGAIELNLKEVNGKTQTRKFSKRYEEALVYIAAQEKQGDQTKFTIGVRLADDDTVVSNLKLYVDNSTTALVNAKIDGEFGNGEEIYDKNKNEATQYVTKIEYEYETANGETGKVEIYKDVYGDYFKVGSDYARLFKATD